MSESKGRSFYYEGMFLFSQAAAADLNAVVERIKEILSRGNAELVAMKKWDERRLAFEIDKQKRGTYILTYFKTDPVNLVGMERDCNLSEAVLRHMFLRADHLTLEEMQATDAREELKTEIALRETKADEEAAPAPSPAAPAPAAAPQSAPAPTA